MTAPYACPVCGASNAPENTFCMNCGTRLAGAAPGAPTPGYAPPTYAPPTYAPPPYLPTGPPGYPGGYGPYPYGPPMRGSGAGDILSGTFEVWTKNLANFFVVYLVLAIVTGLIGAALSLAIIGTLETGNGVVPGSPAVTFTSADLAKLLFYAAAAIVASVILQSVVLGGMTEYAVRRFRGEPMDLGQALRRGLQRFLSVIGANILVTIIIFALVLVPLLLAIGALIVAASGGTSSSGVLVAVCGLLIALLVGGIIAIYVYIALSLYAPAIMIENAGAVGGLSRSWAITKGHRLSIFGALLVILILGSVITAAITIPASLSGNSIVSLIGTIIASAIVGPWSVITVAVAYDLIVRPTTIPSMPPPYAPMPPMQPMPPVAPPPANP